MPLVFAKSVGLVVTPSSTPQRWTVRISSMSAVSRKIFIGVLLAGTAVRLSYARSRPTPCRRLSSAAIMRGSLREALQAQAADVRAGLDRATTVAVTRLDPAQPGMFTAIFAAK